jgi:hypothetical protein
MQLGGKNVIVTGKDRGIGRMISFGFRYFRNRNCRGSPVCRKRAQKGKCGHNFGT